MEMRHSTVSQVYQHHNEPAQELCLLISLPPEMPCHNSYAIPTWYPSLPTG